jgi:hypothetical protein
MAAQGVDRFVTFMSTDTAQTIELCFMAYLNGSSSLEEM